MQDGTEAQIKNALKTEIFGLQSNFRTIQSYLTGTSHDNLEIVEAVRAFRDGLNRISTHILALYQLKGQKAKITWQPLLDNLDVALQTVQKRANPNLRATVQLALGMSDPKIEEVMSYLAKLKESLQ